MTTEEKWKIHYLAEEMSYRRYDSLRIRSSLTDDQVDYLQTLLIKYGSILKGFEKYFFNQWIAGSIITLAVKAPRMSNDAKFIKSILNIIRNMHSKQNQRI
jgi:hypothetical protein